MALRPLLKRGGFKVAAVVVRPQTRQGWPCRIRSTEGTQQSCFPGAASLRWEQEPHDQPTTRWLPLVGLAAATWLGTRDSGQVHCRFGHGQVAQGKQAEEYFAKQLQAHQRKPVLTQIRMHATQPLGAKSNVRIIDIIDGDGIFHEIKTGNVRYTRATINQILKDAHILREGAGDCKGYVFEFFPGKDGAVKVDKRVLELLKENGIKYRIHDHGTTAEAASKCGHCSVEDVKKNVFDKTRQTGSERAASAVNQAHVLQAVGAVNLAVALLSLGVAVKLRYAINELQGNVPELEFECRKLKASLGKIEAELDSALTWPKDKFEHRLCHINHLMKDAKRDFTELRRKCDDITNDATRRKQQSEINAFVSMCTLVLGLTVTVASLGCDCGAGCALGLGGAGAGGVGAAVSIDNIDRCRAILDKTSHQLRAATSADDDLQRKYAVLMGVLQSGMLSNMSEAVWRVHYWTHEPSGYIVNIARDDSLSLLSYLGDGSVLGAAGKQVLIGRFDGGSEISQCTIENIWQTGSSYEAIVQCAASFNSFE